MIAYKDKRLWQTDLLGRAVVYTTYQDAAVQASAPNEKVHKVAIIIDEREVPHDLPCIDCTMPLRMSVTTHADRCDACHQRYYKKHVRRS